MKRTKHQILCVILAQSYINADVWTCRCQCQCMNIKHWHVHTSTADLWTSVANELVRLYAPESSLAKKMFMSAWHGTEYNLDLFLWRLIMSYQQLITSNEKGTVDFTLEKILKEWDPIKRRKWWNVSIGLFLVKNHLGTDACSRTSVNKLTFNQCLWIL